MEVECKLNSQNPSKEDDDYNIDDLPLAVKEWIKRSEHIQLLHVPYRITYEVSRFFPPQCDWKKFASLLGVNHIHELTKIEGDAIAKQKWPSEILLLYCIKNASVTFGDLLKILHEKLRRLDCLQHLYDTNYVSEFLEKWDCKLKHSVQLSKSGLPNDVDVTLPQNQKAKLYPFLYDRNGLLPYAYEGRRNIDGKRISKTKKLVILLTYSKDANEIVPDLVQRFWDIGIGVISEYVLRGKGFFETNYVASWENFFKQSHFVVPLISPQYLRDIQRPSSDSQSQGVLFVYDLYTRKYIKDGCLNNMVRPLLMDGVTARMMRKYGLNPTLEVTWKLSMELDNFLNVMKNYAELQENAKKIK